MIEAKRVPYGVSDFLRVIRENQYYVDKTMYIPLLEAQPDNLIFIRPRRFGKSLFLSMLEAYYDCKIKGPVPGNLRRSLDWQSAYPSTG